MVYGEQGLGDQIIFGTVLPELLKDQKNAILKVDARLKNLFQYSFSNLKIYGEHEDIPDHLYDKYFNRSLCKFYRNHTDDFMNSTFKAYSFKQNLPLNFKNQISKLTNLKIGISWKTFFAAKNDKKRSLTPLEVSTILCNNKILLLIFNMVKLIMKLKKLTN